MARKKKIDLATAKMADAALPSPTSIYDIVGISTSNYRTTDISAYRKQLDKMDLFELHSHAYEVGVLPSHSRSIMIDRLERKFLQSNSPFAAARQNELDKTHSEGTKDPALKEEALKILARGR